MDSTGEGIVLPTKIDLSGFSRGTKQLESAIKSLSNRVKSIGNTTERMASRMANPLKRLLPTILGVGSAYGIISKAVSAFMSQNEELSSRMSSIWTALGNLLGPIITQIIDWVTTAVSYFLSFLKLLGVTSKSASQLSQKASGAAKEMQRTLAGFDELNVLQDNSGGGGGGGGKGLEDVDPSEWMKKLAELLKNKMWDEAADMIIEKLNDIIYKVRDKAYEVGEKIGEYLQGIIHVISRVLNETDWKQLGVGIANFFNGLTKEIEGIDLGRDIGALLVAEFTIAFKMLTGFLETLDWKRMADIFTGIITGALDAMSKAISEGDFQKIGSGIITFIKNIDWESIRVSLGNFLKEAWEGAIDFLKGVITGETSGGEDLPIVRSLERFGEAVNKFADASWQALQDLWQGTLLPILEWAGEVALPGILDSISTEIERLAGLLRGDLSFGDFISSMTKIEGVATAVGIALGTIKLGLFIESVKNLTATGILGKLAEVLALVAGGAGTFGEALTTVFPWIGKVGVGLKALWAIIAANPIVAVIAVIAALAAAFIHAYKTNDEFREKVDKAWAAVKNAISTAVDAAKEKIQSLKEWWDNLRETISTGAENIRERVSNAFDTVNSKIQEVRDWFGNLRDSIIEGANRIGEAISAIRDWFANLGPNIRDMFWQIIAAARSWGADLIQNFINGLADRVDALWESLKNIGQGIKNMWGHSHPKEGPLADDYKWMPDMMDLFTNGINQNKKKVLSAVGDLASGISDEMAGEKIGDGLELPTVDTSFASNVSYTPPVVAGGGFLPYNVGSQGMETVNGGEINSEILAAVLQLQEMITQFENSVENMQWVARFGNIRAVVEEITKIQKQNDRARG